MEIQHLGNGVKIPTDLKIYVNSSYMISQDFLHLKIFRFLTLFCQTSNCLGFII